MRLGTMMREIMVNSHAIQKVAYDFTNWKLKIIWQNGSIGYYLGVPKRSFYALCMAESKGQYINREIKPIFPYEREGKV